MQDPSAESTQPEGTVASDPVRMQILSTEHWSLLATRSMLWNEMFTRTSMFITTLSAAAVALALVAQASEFGDNFRTFSLIVLPVVLLLGIGTLLRLTAALEEDFRLVVGMNRLRNAYVGIAPDLKPHFVTSFHDDLPSIVRTYSSEEREITLRVTPARVLSSTAVIVGVLNCVLAGLVASLITDLVTDRAGLYIGVGISVGLVSAILIVGIMPQRSIGQAYRQYQPRFPAPLREPGNVEHG